MKIYKKCPCCNKTMFLMLGSDFGNEVEFGSSFGRKDHIPYTDTSHEEDWECLTRFLNCLSNSHGEVFISLKDKEKERIPKDYKETILNFTEGGFKEEEKPKEKTRTEEPKNTSQNTPKTIKDWYESKKISYSDYKLLTTPWGEQDEENSLLMLEVVLDTNTLYNWEEIKDYLKRAKLVKQKEEERKRREEEIEKKMNDGKDWSQISPVFKQEGDWTYKRNWISVGFTYSQVKEWMDAGLAPNGEEGDNAFFAAWMRDKKKLSPQQVLNYGNLERLREEYNKEVVRYFD